MAGQLRVYRRRIRSVQATKKITRAMELIAASRIVKAQQRVAESTPYAEAITRAVSAVASYAGNVDHPLTTEKEQRNRAALLLLTADRGLAGAYSSNAIREGERLSELLRSEGKEIVPFVVGRKGVGFYRFRGRELAGQWQGFTDNPTYGQAKEIADAVIDAFLRPTDEGGVDEIHLVYTHFVSSVTQRTVARRLLPLEVEESEEEPEGGAFPLYEFEPSAEGLLDALLPKYITTGFYFYIIEAAAS